MKIKIAFAKTQKDYFNAKVLFKEYAKSLDFSLSFQDIDKELENIPGKYENPNGCIILVWDNLDTVGCVGMRPLENNSCEIKRLYLKPSYRGFGLGKILTEKVIEYCRKSGYIKVYLDTTTRMEPAINIYKSLGFVETSPYYNNPLTDVIFFELNLCNSIKKK